MKIATVRGVPMFVSITFDDHDNAPLNRSKLGEPDFVADFYEGNHVCMVRNDLGAWCGYIAVRPDHPWMELVEQSGNQYLGDEFDSLFTTCSPHGGITYCGNGGISFNSVPQMPDGSLWVGFDCAHMGDLIPGMSVYRNTEYDVYRSLDYVKAILHGMAYDLKNADTARAMRRRVLEVSREDALRG